MQKDAADIFAYNISPDFLSGHPDITAAATHQISRFTHVPGQYRKAHYVQLHLLVDDFAHHGRICEEAVRTFNTDARGYAYVTGRPLVEPIAEYCRMRNIAMEYRDAVYFSHMIIELSVDIYLRRSDEGEELVRLVRRGIGRVGMDYFREFTEILSWLFAGVSADMVRQALGQVTKFYRSDRLLLSADAHDRIQYYARRLGEIKTADDRRSYEGMRMLVEKGLALMGDPTEYLREVVVQALLESPYCREITEPW